MELYITYGIVPFAPVSACECVLQITFRVFPFTKDMGVCVTAWKSGTISTGSETYTMRRAPSK